jgi:neutral ceramidase
MLQIGTAKVIVTPPKGTLLCGYPNTKIRKNIGKDQDLYAKALFLTNGKKKMLVITADLISAPANFVAEVRQGINQKTGIPKDAIMISVSHTHSGPIQWGDTASDKKYRVRTVKNFIAVGVAAAKKTVPVQVGYGIGQADLGHNRRVVKNGKAENVWVDLEKKHTGPTDKQVLVIKVTNAKGKVAAVLAGYACHPVVMGPRNFIISPDYPGYMKRFVEKALPGSQAFFINTGGGDINPYNCIQADFAVVKKAGETLGKEVVRLLKNIKTVEMDDLRYTRVKLELAPKPRPASEKGKPRWRKLVKGKIVTEVQLFKIGKILFVSAPGELTVGIAKNIKHSSPLPFTMPFGYTNDSIGYLPSDWQMPQGGYEVNASPSRRVEKPLLAAMKKGLKKL